MLMLAICQLHDANSQLTALCAHAATCAAMKEGKQRVMLSLGMWRASGSGCAGSAVTMSGRNRVSGPRKRSTPTPQLRGVQGYWLCRFGFRAYWSEAPEQQRARARQEQRRHAAHLKRAPVLAFRPSHSRTCLLGSASNFACSCACGAWESCGGMTRLMHSRYPHGHCLVSIPAMLQDQVRIYGLSYA